jgi:hypothetical protein
VGISTDDSYNLELLLQKILACIGERLMIIGDQDACRAFLFSDERSPEMLNSALCLAIA